MESIIFIVLLVVAMLFFRYFSFSKLKHKRELRSLEKYQQEAFEFGDHEMYDYYTSKINELQNATNR